MKRLMGVLLGLAVAGGALLAPQAANAADPVYGYKNQATTRCIDDTSAGFRTWPCNGTPAQKWTVHTWNDGTVRLQNGNTGRCIFDSNQGFHTSPCDSSTNQSWIVKYYNDGTRRFQNQATLRCMDDSSQGFRTWPCNDGQNQSWFRV